MNKLFFVIGASGSGKTTIIKYLEKLMPEYQMFYFDSIGVPSYEEMVEKYRSAEEWQRTKTFEWVKKIKEQTLITRPAILDGQIRPQFIKEACTHNQILNYGIILIDCSDEERIKRLTIRGQPELANQQMMDWAKYLRQNCQDCCILDNTLLNEKESALSLIEILKK